jgi:dTDP-4-dehydrorhamnose 3,5-epimerase
VEVLETSLNDVYILRTRPFQDERGFFTRTFDAAALPAMGIASSVFVQESQSRSGHGTLRGIHLRTDGLERKIVRCASGSIHDVVVDLRPNSSTFGQWESFLLDDVRHDSVVIPSGCGHGFQVLSEVADVCYKMDAPYAPEFDATLSFDDPDVAIRWPLPPQRVSDRDRHGSPLASVVDQLRRMAWA